MDESSRLRVLADELARLDERAESIGDRRLDHRIGEFLCARSKRAAIMQAGLEAGRLLERGLDVSPR